MKGVLGRASEALSRKPLAALMIIPLLFLAVRLSIVPAAWPERAPVECIYSEAYDGCGFVFDEAHYVPAARKIIMGDLAVNVEHPPLSKLVIIAGIRAFGDNPWGWRSFSILFSAATLLLAGLLAYELSRSFKASITAQALMFTDVAFFNISGFAILDPPALALMMLALYLYVRGLKLPSAAALGLSMLAKSSMMLAALSLLAIELAYPIVNGRTIGELTGCFRKAMREIVIPALAVFLAGLGVYDAVSGAFPTPLHHLDFILRYHSGLVFEDPVKVELPLSWILPPIARPPSAYYVVTVQPPGWHPVAFWGVSSPLWWSIWVLAPLAYLLLKGGRPVANPSLEVMFLGWVTATYGTFLLLGYAYRRWMYLFYFLQVSIPMAVSLPAIFEKSGYGLLLKALMALQATWFVMWFPVKPEWLLKLMLDLGLGDVPWI